MAKLVEIGKQSLVKARPHLETFWYYAKVELAPPKLNEIPQALSGFSRIISSAKSGAWKQLTVRQAWLNTVVGLEVLGWFFIGEIIGKRHVVGYKVK